MEAEAGGSAELVLVLDLFFLRLKTNFFRSFLVAGEIFPVVDWLSDEWLHAPAHLTRWMSLSWAETMSLFNCSNAAELSLSSMFALDGFKFRISEPSREMGIRLSAVPKLLDTWRPPPPVGLISSRLPGDSTGEATIFWAESRVCNWCWRNWRCSFKASNHLPNSSRDLTWPIKTRFFSQFTEIGGCV